MKFVMLLILEIIVIPESKIMGDDIRKCDLLPIRFFKKKKYSIPKMKNC